MPAYGTAEAVKQLLRTNDAAEFSADEEARITALLPVVSLAIEQITGATFHATAPAATARDQEGDGTSRLYLDMGLRSVTTIKEDVTWSAGTWFGGTTLTTSQYRLSGLRSTGGYRILDRMDGAWSGPVVITGVWEDTYVSVPDDITYIANFVAAEIFKGQQASPHGLMGPEGSMVPIRNALAAPEVRLKLDHYRVGPGIWVL